MKKILFCFINYQIGGVATSLVNLLNQIHGNYDITLFCLSGEGPLRKDIPKDVTIIETNRMVSMLSDTQKLTMQKSKVLGLLRGCMLVLSRVFGSVIFKRLLFNTLPNLPEYDVAISFIHDPNFHIFSGGCNRYVIEKVKAKKKISFIHCDFENYGGNTMESRELYKKFDVIACCSEGCKRVFDSCIPGISEKTKVSLNCFQYERILELSTENDAGYDTGKFNVVTVSRLSQEKGLDMAMEAIYLVSKKHPNIQWHIVGTGADYESLINQRHSLGLDDIVVFHGEKKNPYPYIKAANLLLLPSRHECAPMVFNEAWCLGTPILATRTTSVKEMIEEPEVGLICDHTVESMRESLDKLIDNPLQLELYKRNMQIKPLSNDMAVKQFDDMVD